MVDEDVVSHPISHHVPSKNATKTWLTLLDYAKAPYSKQPFGPKSVKALRFWSNEKDAADFRLPREDPCIRFAFNNAKKANDALFKFSKSTANFAGATANALFSSSEGIVGIGSKIDAFERLLEPEDPLLNKLDELRDDLKNIKKPIDDAVRISASVFGGAVSAIRNAVAPHAGNVADMLKETPPADGFFFGNRDQEIDSCLSIQQNAEKKSTAKPPNSKFRGKSTQKFRSSTNISSSSSSTSKSTSASSSSRDSKKPSSSGNFRGGKGGKKSK